MRIIGYKHFSRWLSVAVALRIGEQQNLIIAQLVGAREDDRNEKRMCVKKRLYAVWTEI